MRIPHRTIHQQNELEVHMIVELLQTVLVRLVVIFRSAGCANHRLDDSNHLVLRRQQSTETSTPILKAAFGCEGLLHMRETVVLMNCQ
jgi:hypothetical protein